MYETFKYKLFGSENSTSLNIDMLKYIFVENYYSNMLSFVICHSSLRFKLLPNINNTVLIL